MSRCRRTNAQIVGPDAGAWPDMKPAVRFTPEADPAPFSAKHPHDDVLRDGRAATERNQRVHVGAVIVVLSRFSASVSPSVLLGFSKRCSEMLLSASERLSRPKRCSEMLTF